MRNASQILEAVRDDIIQELESNIYNAIRNNKSTCEMREVHETSFSKYKMELVKDILESRGYTIIQTDKGHMLSWTL